MVILVITLYPLSLGPMVWLANRGVFGGMWYSLVVLWIIYWPITRLCEMSDSLQRVLNWYVEFWDR
jgi:hypothetical protein